MGLLQLSPNRRPVHGSASFPSMCLLAEWSVDFFWVHWIWKSSRTFRCGWGRLRHIPVIDRVVVASWRRLKFWGELEKPHAVGAICNCKAILVLYRDLISKFSREPHNIQRVPSQPISFYRPTFTERRRYLNKIWSSGCELYFTSRRFYPQLFKRKWGIDIITIIFKDLETFPIISIPNPNGIVIRARNKRSAVRRKGYWDYPVHVPIQRLQIRSCFCIP